MAADKRSIAIPDGPGQTARSDSVYSCEE
jgi:hypothetical protein